MQLQENILDSTQDNCLITSRSDYNYIDVNHDWWTYTWSAGYRSHRYSVHRSAWLPHSDSVIRSGAADTRTQDRSYHHRCSLGSNPPEESLEACPRIDRSCLGKESVRRGVKCGGTGYCEFTLWWGKYTTTHDRCLHKPPRVANRVKKCESLLHTILDETNGVY